MNRALILKIAGGVIAALVLMWIGLQVYANYRLNDFSQQLQGPVSMSYGKARASLGGTLSIADLKLTVAGRTLQFHHVDVSYPLPLVTRRDWIFKGERLIWSDGYDSGEVALLSANLHFDPEQLQLVATAEASGIMLPAEFFAIEKKDQQLLNWAAKWTDVAGQAKFSLTMTDSQAQLQSEVDLTDLFIRRDRWITTSLFAPFQRQGVRSFSNPAQAFNSVFLLEWLHDETDQGMQQRLAVLAKEKKEVYELMRDLNARKNSAAKQLRKQSFKGARMLAAELAESTKPYRRFRMSLQPNSPVPFLAAVEMVAAWEQGHPEQLISQAPTFGLGIETDL